MDDDLLEKLEELLERHQVGAIQLPDAAEGFLVNMQERLESGLPMTDNMIVRINEIYEERLT